MNIISAQWWHKWCDYCQYAAADDNINQLNLQKLRAHQRTPLTKSTANRLRFSQPALRKSINSCKKNEVILREIQEMKRAASSKK